MSKEIHAVTGAFGFTGKYIASRLLKEGYEVITLTNSYMRGNPFGANLKAFPFNFDDPKKLTEFLEGVSVLYNTYWVRFNHRDFNYEMAIENTRRLFDCARRAGVRRVVHISITNPSQDSPLGYFKGKAIVERALIDSGLSYAILRPAVIFGDEDILINNIAWVLRHFPAFGIFGNGEYKLQPVYVEDLAELAVKYGISRENAVINAIGPETFTYKELVKTIGKAIGRERPVVPLPDFLSYAVGFVLGVFLGDVFITKEEIEGLKSGLLCVNSPPTCRTSLTEWAKRHAQTLGIRYRSELKRRRNRSLPYELL